MGHIILDSVLQSDSIDQLSLALAQAQGEMVNAAKTSDNPSFRSKYADLASVWDAIRGPLSKHGLSVTQTFRKVATSAEYTVVRTAKTGEVWETRLQHLADLVTTLHHASGQWIASELPVMSEWGNPQALGSTITYLRRYSLQAACGIAPEDDDGNAATGRDHDEGQRFNSYHDRPAQRSVPQSAQRRATPSQPAESRSRPTIVSSALAPWETGAKS
jgi:hypothetical protein